MYLFIYLFISCLMTFAQQNVIDNELPHCTINSCSLYQKNKQFHNMERHISVQQFLCQCPMSNSIKCFFASRLTCIQECRDYGTYPEFACANMEISVPCACLEPNWLSAVHRYTWGVATERPAQVPWREL